MRGQTNRIITDQTKHSDGNDVVFDDMDDFDDFDDAQDPDALPAASKLQEPAEGSTTASPRDTTDAVNKIDKDPLLNVQPEKATPKTVMAKPRSKNSHDTEEQQRSLKHDVQIKTLETSIDRLQEENEQLRKAKKEHDLHMTKCNREKLENKKDVAGANKDSTAAFASDKYKQAMNALQLERKLHFIALAKAMEEYKGKLERLEKKKDAEIKELRQVITLEMLK